MDVLFVYDYYVSFSAVLCIRKPIHGTGKMYGLIWCVTTVTYIIVKKPAVVFDFEM